MNDDCHFQFLVGENPNLRIAIGSTDRGWIRLKKIVKVLKGFRLRKRTLVSFHLNFDSSRKMVIRINDDSYIYDLTTNIIRKLRRKRQDLAVLFNPTPFILPSESLRAAILRVVRLSLVNVNKSKEAISVCIEDVVIGSNETLCSDITTRQFNSYIIEILDGLQISTLVIQLDCQSKHFPNIENYHGKLVFFEVASSSGFPELGLVQVYESV
jgi:ribosomal protein L30/L7E